MVGEIIRIKVLAIVEEFVMRIKVLAMIGCIFSITSIFYENNGYITSIRICRLNLRSYVE